MFLKLCVIGLMCSIIHIQGAYGYKYMMISAWDQSLHVHYSNTAPYHKSKNVQDKYLNLEDVYHALRSHSDRNLGVQAIDFIDASKNRRRCEKLVVDKPGSETPPNHWYLWETFCEFMSESPSPDISKLINDVCTQKLNV
ncbi:hypothetical protein PGT21_024424 [Puccinia graminis f. sp. tritici]|uniref:Uncharacterized protein n=1 Tax=Puccinia graminis f. sp. tritici TaxID=56615 RepID=A0A5B0MJP2_PUCGR|nr:hypothetical protein PGT21_024424 [Puccinia graminis f. sp. tritici]KAA1078906.1 hypothetical protein PGTUg99_019401 [Puccinia graminis f. sp. tritici]